MDRDIYKITDKKIVDRISAQLRKFSRFIYGKPVYINRRTMCHIIQTRMFIPNGQRSGFLYRTNASGPYNTVFIMDGTYYMIQNLNLNMPNETLIFGYVSSSVFYSMDVFILNSVDITKQSFNVRRRLVEEFVMVNNQGTSLDVFDTLDDELNPEGSRHLCDVNEENISMVAIQPVFNVNDIKSVSANRIFFYNIYGFPKIMKWTDVESIHINTVHVKNFIMENSDFKIYDKERQERQTLISSSLNSELEDGDICIFRVEGQNTHNLKFIGKNPTETRCDTVSDYLSAVTFFVDRIEYSELKMLVQ
jgi:hypothetical protein